MGQLKRCTGCGGEFPLSMFHKEKKGHCAKCKTCKNEITKQWSRKNKEKKQFDNRLRRYGVSRDEFFTMLEDQHYSCLVCENPITTKTANIDHCHSGGHVRGLLCGTCNTALGMVNDDVEILKRAIEYLEYGKTKMPNMQTTSNKDLNHRG